MAERRILIAIDGSQHSEKAFEWYCNNIHQDGDVLILIHSLELPPKPPTPFPFAEKPFEVWRRQIDCIRDESRTMLKSYQQRCDDKKIEILSAVQDERSIPGPSICKVSKENNVAMIVLGSRGLSKMRRTILGSVSDYVVHNSHLPVCVVRDHDVVSPRSPSPGKDRVKRQNTAPAPTVNNNSSSSLSDSTKEI